MTLTKKKQVKIYSDSLFVILKKNNASSQQFSQIANELFLLNAFINSSENCKQFFLENNFNEELKQQILFKSFPGLSSLTKIFLSILFKKKHFFLFSEINAHFQTNLLKTQQIIKLKIILSSSIAENEKRKFSGLFFNLLKKYFNSSNFLLNISYDPKILGGMIIQNEYLLIDLSIKNQLKNLIKY